MKILKVKIKRTQTPEKTSYEYPNEYDAKKIRVMVYESHLPEVRETVVSRGNDHEYLIGVVKNEDAAQFLLSEDITELTKQEALEHGAIWTKQREKITDTEKVLKILAKAARKEKLDKEEEDAIDPDNNVAGVNKTKSFEQVLNEHEAELN